MVMNFSDHLLMRRVGEALIELLQKAPLLQRLEYLPPGQRPEVGTAAPDLFVTLDPAIYRELGFVMVEPDADREHVDIVPGQTAHFFVSDRDGNWQVIAARVGNPNPGADPPSYALTITRTGPKGGKFSSSSGGYRLDAPYGHQFTVGGRTVEVTLRKLEGEGVRVTAGFVGMG